MECVEKLIKKDWQHPLTGEKLAENDIILLQRVRSTCKHVYFKCAFIFISIQQLFIFLGWNGIFNNKCELAREKCKTSFTSLILLNKYNFFYILNISVLVYYLTLKT